MLLFYTYLAMHRELFKTSQKIVSYLKIKILLFPTWADKQNEIITKKQLQSFFLSYIYICSQVQQMFQELFVISTSQKNSFSFPFLCKLIKSVKCFTKFLI